MKTKMRVLWAVVCLTCGGMCIGMMAEDPTGTLYTPYPQPDKGYVTDIANLLAPEQEEQLEELLSAYEKENGIEMAVVTIGSITDYPGTDNGSVETFATGLFNQYSIGNMPKNDGVLLLVAVKDRQARIELGDGHGSDHDKDADRILQNVIVPQFKNGHYDRGILDGTQSILLKFGGKDAMTAPKSKSGPNAVPAEEVPATQNAVSNPNNAVPSRSPVPSQNAQPVRYVPPGRNVVNQSPVQWITVLLCLGVPVMVLLAGLNMVRGKQVSESSVQNSMSEPDNSETVHNVHNIGILGGLFGASLGRRSSLSQGISFGGRSSHNHGIGLGSGRSHGGFGGGSSGSSHRSGFGGGFSRGGGATGKW
ncbi:MAG: TPM domain-containing protein [Anaerohalosphaeraceae bacterium]